MKANNLVEVALLFFKLGCIAFGGPAAHIAMFEDEVVNKRQWMSRQHFIDLLGATNLIPGPNSTEMVMHCGYERAGWQGLVVAGLCFIFPAVLITAVFAWLYQQYGQLPAVEPFIYGIKPAVIAIIVVAAYRLGRKAINNNELALLAGIVLLACLLGVNEIVALFAGGLLGLLLYLFKQRQSTLHSFVPVTLLAASDPINVTNGKLFLAFLKVGAILYGSGYVLIAFLEAELVSKGWLTQQVLIDSVAVGQFTPGPVLSTATFVGWQMNGLTGALLATVAIFLPSFVFVLILNPLVAKIRKSALLSAVLDAINAAAIALIVAVCIDMAKVTLTDWRTIVIALISFIVVFTCKKLNSAVIVFGGAVGGYLLTFF